MGGNHKRTDPKLSKAHTRHDMCVIVGGNIIHGRRMVSSFGGHTHTMRRKLLPVAEGNPLLNSHNNLQLALNIYILKQFLHYLIITTQTSFSQRWMVGVLGEELLLPTK